ncbi:MAG: class I SAM-dependent methyltransferase [Anaerolineae bacterium]|nr:class I SAM-dependent methyltransferase [Anaerolineae bacterium]
MCDSFDKSAAWYDAIYDYKDYEREAQIIHTRIEQYGRSEGKNLLDVACGTGRHLEYLRQHYTVSGLDISPGLLDAARQRCPDVPFFEADMVDFELGEQVDVITCLFSAIGYVRTVDRLGLALGTMSRHIKPGGLVIIEPWFAPDDWHPGSVHANFVNRPDLKVARVTISERDDSISRNVFHFLVATPDGIEYFTENHELGLFTHEEYLKAFQNSGLDVIYDADGLTGRGLYVGRQPQA